MVSQVSTLNLYQSTVQNFAQVENNINNIQEQVSSGSVSQNFQGLGNQVELYTTLENQLADATQYTQGNTSLQALLNTSSSTLGQIVSIANNAQNLVLQARNGSEANSLAFDQQLYGYFQSVAQALNTQQNGQYIFSGTRGDQQPVDPNTFPASTDPASTAYYNGSTNVATVTISDNTAVPSGVTGGDPAFQKIMAAFAVAKQGFDQGSDTLLQQAYTMMQQGVTAVTALQTSVDATSKQVDQANSINSAQSTYWKTLKGSVTNADLVSLSTQLATDQGVLQASFQVFAKISSLNLSSYLGTTGG